MRRYTCILTTRCLDEAAPKRRRLRVAAGRDTRLLAAPAAPAAPAAHTAPAAPAAPPTPAHEAAVAVAVALAEKQPEKSRTKQLAKT